MAEVIRYLHQSDPYADFTDVQEWADSWTDSNNPDQVGILVGGANVAGGTIAPMTSATPDADEHPRLVADVGCGTRGYIPLDLSEVCRVNSLIENHCGYLSLGREPGRLGEGFMIDIDGVNSPSTARALRMIVSGSSINASGFRIDSLIVRLTNPGQFSGAGVQVVHNSETFGDVSGTVNNSVFYYTGTDVNYNQTNGLVVLAVLTVSGKMMTINWNHNLLIADVENVGNQSHYVNKTMIFSMAEGNTAVLNAKNNMFFCDTSDAMIEQGASGNYTYNCSHNMTQDETADDILGGTNNVVNASAAAQFIDRTRNWWLKPASDARDAGTHVIAYDMRGRAQDDGTRRTIGPIEKVPNVRQLQMLRSL